MLQTINQTPAGLADLLDQMTQATIEQDREAATILAHARESMRALAWNRYAIRKTRESERRRFIRQHKARAEYARARE
jgi:hypothetical protein